jgi:hypothetical protein
MSGRVAGEPVFESSTLPSHTHAHTHTCPCAVRLPARTAAGPDAWLPAANATVSVCQRHSWLVLSQQERATATAAATVCHRQIPLTVACANRLPDQKQKLWPFTRQPDSSWTPDGKLPLASAGLEKKRTSLPGKEKSTNLRRGPTKMLGAASERRGKRTTVHSHGQAPLLGSRAPRAHVPRAPGSPSRSTPHARAPLAPAPRSLPRSAGLA